MFQSLQTLVQGAVMERLTLLINHVLSAEPVAMTRLQRHSGSTVLIGFKGWPSLLPALPVVAFHVTPAGLVEWLQGSAALCAAVAHRGRHGQPGARCSRRR